MSPGNNFGWEFFFIKIKNKQKKKKREKVVKIIKLPQTIALWFCLTRLWMRPNQTHFKNSPRLHRQGLNFYHLKYKQTLAKAQSSSLDLHCFFGFVSIQSVVPERGFFFFYTTRKPEASTGGETTSTCVLYYRRASILLLPLLLFILNIYTSQVWKTESKFYDVNA